MIWINGHNLETVASWSGRAAACTDIYAFQTAVVESMSLSGCPACWSLTEHSLYEVRRDFCSSSPPIPAQKTSNKAKFGWVCTEMTWSVHMHPLPTFKSLLQSTEELKLFKQEVARIVQHKQNSFPFPTWPLPWKQTQLSILAEILPTQQYSAWNSPCCWKG